MKLKLFLLSLLLSSPLFSQMLNVPLRTQEMNQWCWSATTQATGMFYGRNQSQCNIVTVAQRQGFPVRGNCCQNKQSCNQPNGINNAGGISPVMRAIGIPVRGNTGGPLSEAQFRNQIQSRAPFTIAWYWNQGGGHVVVARGYNNGNVHWMDPWYGEGYKAGSYRSALTAGGRGRWSDTILTGR